MNRNWKRPAPGRSLAERHPHLVEEFVVNVDVADRGPDLLTCGSENRCQWRCVECGHKWIASAAMRATGRGCPACGRRKSHAAMRTAPSERLLSVRHPDIAATFVENLDHPGRGPDLLTSGSGDRCAWACSCGHRWETTVDTRVRSGCRRCGGRVALPA